jgi:hypothetical protein
MGKLVPPTPRPLLLIALNANDLHLALVAGVVGALCTLTPPDP